MVTKFEIIYLMGRLAVERSNISTYLKRKQKSL